MIRAQSTAGSEGDQISAPAAQVCPLDADIFLLIFDTLNDQGDVSAMMHTSWFVYRLGVGRLLSMGAHITNDSKLVSFCHFVRRNNLHAYHLAWLWLDIPRFSLFGDCDDSSSEDSVGDEDYDRLHGIPLLVSILPSLVGIRTLQIDYCEGLLHCDDRLVDAFAALPSVRDLRVISFGLLSYDLISSIRSDIVILYMECSGDEHHLFPPMHRIFPDPLDLLSRHKDTLEDLWLCYVDLTAEIVHPGPSTSIYPNVRCLTLGATRFRELEILVNAFPNLRILDVTMCDVLEFDMDCPRARNRMVPCWDALEHVCGDVHNIYRLGLTCPVARLDIVLDNPAESREELYEALTDVQWSTTLRRIVFRLGFYTLIAGHEFSDDCCISASDISELLPPLATASSVTHLGLDLNADVVVGDPIYYQRAAVSLLSRLRVKFFRFRIHVCNFEREDAYDHTVPLGPDRMRVLRKFRAPFLTFWASRIADAAPTVQFICFEVMQRKMYWQVLRHPGGGEHSLVVLSEEASRELVENEQMEWYEALHPVTLAAPHEGAVHDDDSGSDAMSVTSDSSQQSDSALA
ncbi:hypothetical protein C8Q73DRAFT_839773 [Cubamyces lactineus]|nr:hypothetical protein C8Q73DRAFT_839773 [Cubamyces lactineus]